MVLSWLIRSDQASNHLFFFLFANIFTTDLFLVVLLLSNLTHVMILLWLLNLHSYLQGSAEVVYARRSDAFAALKRYNNVQLDGKPMKIEIIGVNAEMPRVNVIGGVNGRRTVVMTYALDSRSFTTICVVLLELAVVIFLFLFLLVIFFFAYST